MKSVHIPATSSRWLFWNHFGQIDSGQGERGPFFVLHEHILPLKCIPIRNGIYEFIFRNEEIWNEKSERNKNRFDKIESIANDFPYIECHTTAHLKRRAAQSNERIYVERERDRAGANRIQNMLKINNMMSYFRIWRFLWWQEITWWSHSISV